MKPRTALALAAGTFAAVAVTGTALAVGDDDPARRASVSVEASPSDDGILLDDSVEPLDSASPSASPSPDDSAWPSDSPAPDDSASPSDSPSPDDPSWAGSSGTASVSRSDAERIAVRAAGGGRVTKVEREAEHGRPVYKVEVQVGGAEHDLYIDRETGAVLRHKVDRDDRGRRGDDD